MAITLVVAQGNNSSTATTSITFQFSTTQAGDLLVVNFVHRGTGDGTLSGTTITTGGMTWTLKHSQLFASSTFSGKTYWARATGDHNAQTLIVSGLTNSSCGGYLQLRGGLASGDPLTAATIVGEQNASGDTTQAEITTTVNSAWVVLCVANSPDLFISSAPTATDPTTLPIRTQPSSTGGTDTSLIIAAAEKATAGATGAFAWTQTAAASGSWAYAIEPEPPAAPIPFVVMGPHVPEPRGWPR